MGSSTENLQNQITGDAIMSSPIEMQLFVMKKVPKIRLTEEEDGLREDGCIDIKHKLESGGYTITALCPKRDDTQNNTIDDTE